MSDSAEARMRPIHGQGWSRQRIGTYSKYASAKAARDWVGERLGRHQRVGIVSSRGRHHLYVYTFVSAETGEDTK